MKTVKPPKEPRVKWNDNIKLALIQGLLHQHRLRPADSGFKIAAWQYVIPFVQAQSTKPGVVIRYQACKSKLSDIKSNWMSFKDVQRQSGFGVESGVLTAHEEVWDRYIEVFPYCFCMEQYLLIHI